MKKKDILHIYAGTAGNAGSYIRELFLSLEENFTQEIIVNYYYPKSYGKAKRFFYRFSELSSNYKYKYNKIRLIVRFFELFMGLIRSYIYLVTHKVSLLNYSLTSDLYLELMFLKFVKSTTKTKVLITCHDVVPFGTDNQSELENKIKKKKRFFQLADYLIIHNKNSRVDLQKYYKIQNKIVEYPFPIMDLRSNFVNPKRTEEAVRFGMIGHIRNEKGLDVLIDAWHKFYRPDKKAELVIAGNFATKDNYDIQKLREYSINVIPQFISDAEYIKIINEVDVVILPYKRGTNSGIPSSVISLDTLLLASDIPMFKENNLINPEFLFKTQNSLSLVKKMNWVLNMSEDERQLLRNKNKELFERYRCLFYDKVNQAYNNLIKNV